MAVSQSIARRAAEILRFSQTRRRRHLVGLGLDFLLLVLDASEFLLGGRLLCLFTKGRLKLVDPGVLIIGLLTQSKALWRRARPLPDCSSAISDDAIVNRRIS